MISLVANAIVAGTTSGIDTTGANLIVGWYTSSQVRTFSDSKGNTWDTLTFRNDGVATRGQFVYCLNPIVGSGHTFTVSSAVALVAVAAFSGVLTSSAFDQENGAAPGTDGESLTTGSITPSEDNELVIAAVGNERVATSSYVHDSANSFTLINSLGATATTFGGALAYQIQTTATARSHLWTWTGSARRISAIASFKAAPGGGPTSKFWSVPTSAVNGTVAEIAVMSEDRTTVLELVEATVTGGVFLAECTDQSRVTGTKFFAVLHNWDGSMITSSIRGGLGIAEVIEV